MQPFQQLTKEKGSSANPDEEEQSNPDRWRQQDGVHLLIDHLDF